MDPQPKKSNTVDIRREAKQCVRCGQRYSGDAQFCPFDGVKLDPATYDPRDDALLGSTLDGRYEVVDVLGEGGTGRVYKVRHTTLNRFFAMKLLRRDLAGDEELAGRFIQEAKATARVQHSNIVEITDFGKLPDGLLFLVTELLVGRTLGEVIRTCGPVEVGRAANIAKQIAGGLGAAHAVGVVHRDLKPDNVFLVEAPNRGALVGTFAHGPDNVRVVDFGAAKLVGANRLTRDGIVFGTPHYMAPEQASGEPVDHRADVYALGIIMYEMFTGRVPFEADTYMGVLTQHMFVQPLPPSQAMPVGADLGFLEKITLVCLAKKRDDRYATMEIVAREIDEAIRLRGFSGARSLPSLHGGPDADATAFDSDDAVGSGEDGPMFLPKRQGLAMPIVCGGVVLALLALAWAQLGRKAAGLTDSHLAAHATGVSVASPPPAIAPISALASSPVIMAAPPSTTASGVRPHVRGAHGAERLPGSSLQPSRNGAHHAPPQGTAIDDVGDPFAPPR